MVRPDTAVVLGSLIALLGCAHSQGRATEVPESPLSPIDDRPNPNLVLGLPADGDPSDDLFIDRGYWVASYNPARLVPNWVAWTLKRDDLGTAARQNNFRSDELLPAFVRRVRSQDYLRVGFDRGHMCPSADRTSSIEANSSTFLMTNIQPQAHGLNAGPWAALEEYARDAARSGALVQIFAGGVFGTEVTDRSGISVPTSNFKILVMLRPGQTSSDVDEGTRLVAVLIPNVPHVSKDDWRIYGVSVDEVERSSGYDFLAILPDPLESVIEGRVGAAVAMAAPSISHR
jgi:endonuclease G